MKSQIHSILLFVLILAALVGCATDDAGANGDTIDPSSPLTPVAFYPSKDLAGACADASVGIEFNRLPIILSGKSIEIRELNGTLFDSVTSSVDKEAGYNSELVERTSGGVTYNSDALYVVNNTVVFHPKSSLENGKTYEVIVEEGLITDSDGTAFSVDSGWTFTVRNAPPATSDEYTLAADGNGDFCSLEGLLTAMPQDATRTRTVTVKPGVYPGSVQMKHNMVHFVGDGLDKSVFASKNSAQMNSNREGLVVWGDDVTFEALMIYNTFPHDSNGRQAEALRINKVSERVFLKNVHLRSHQDTLRVDGPTTFMQGGIISGSTDPLWGYGGFYCDGCELRSRTDGHALVVARSSIGFALNNCKMTREDKNLKDTYLAQYHDGSTEGKIAFVNCQFDDHIVGWRRTADTWWEYGNTRLSDGKTIAFDGVQLTESGTELATVNSPQNWLGWRPE